MNVSKSWISREFWLVSIAALSLAVVIGTSTVLEPVLLPVVIGIIFFPLIFMLQVHQFLILIALFIFIDRSFLALGGSYIRIYQVLFLIMSLKFALEMVFRERKVYKTPLFLIMNLWVISFFLSYPFVLNYIDFWTVVIGQLFLNMLFFLVVQITFDKGEIFFRQVLKYSILSGGIVALVGILQWIGFFVGIDIGVSHYEEIGIPRPASFAHEPDWYGLFSAYSAIWFLVMYISKDETLFSMKFIRICILVCFLGVILSMARASLLSLAIACVFLFIVTKSMKLLKLGLVFILVILLMITGLFIVDRDIGVSIYERLNPTTSLETDSGAADSRVAAIQMMLDHIPIHPIVGNGSGGMATLSQMQEMRDKYIYGGELNAGKGNANIFLTLMFDTGIIGTILFLILIGQLIYMIMTTFSKVSYVSLGFAATSLLLLVDFNFNNGFRMGFVWVHFALIVTYYMIRTEKKVNIHKTSSQS